MELDTPKTAALVGRCRELCSRRDWLSAIEAVFRVACLCLVMEARARRNGRMAWRMRNELVATKRHRDALGQALALALRERAKAERARDKALKRAWLAERKAAKAGKDQP
jgi:hypothetical protein